MEVVKPTKAGEKYKPKVYRTKQLEFADEVRILDDDLFVSVPANRLLNRWVLTNRIVPVIFLPVRYSLERRRFEFLKQPIFTEGGLLRVSAYPKISEYYERNPTSNVDGYVEISGSETKTEQFSDVVSTVDIFTADNDIYVELSKDGVEFLPKILLRGSINQAYSIDFSTKAVRFSNVVTDGTKNGKYQVVGYR